MTTPRKTFRAGQAVEIQIAIGADWTPATYDPAASTSDRDSVWHVVQVGKSENVVPSRRIREASHA